MFSDKYIEINGIEHYVLEYYAGEEKPVILYVHGGPGRAESLAAWEMQAVTGDSLNFVFYDQRGSGRTYAKNPGKMPEYDEIYSDLVQIADYVYEKYNKKFILMAHDFGTIPAIRYVREYPQKVESYIGYGQAADMEHVAVVRCNRVKELALKSGRKRDAATIDKISDISNGTFAKELLKPKQITKLNVLLSKYNVASGTDKVLIKHIPKSPKYELFDLKIFMNGPKINYKLNEYFKKVNLYNEEMNYEVPMLFISGDWDYQDPYITMQSYVEKITAPYKEIHLIKDVGSAAMFDNSDEFWGTVMKFAYR